MIVLNRANVKAQNPLTVFIWNVGELPTNQILAVCMYGDHIKIAGINLILLFRACLQTQQKHECYKVSSMHTCCCSSIMSHKHKMRHNQEKVKHGKPEFRIHYDDRERDGVHADTITDQYSDTNVN